MHHKVKKLGNFRLKGVIYGRSHTRIVHGRPFILARYGVDIGQILRRTRDSGVEKFRFI